jgi:uncharacterized membrane protein YkoI
MAAGLLRSLWQRLIGQVRPHTRLTGVEAIARARAAADEAYRERLTMTTLIEHDGTWVWHVSEPAIGRVYSVEIDDASGQVLRAGLTGFR